MPAARHRDTFALTPQPQDADTPAPETKSTPIPAADLDYAHLLRLHRHTDGDLSFAIANEDDWLPTYAIRAGRLETMFPEIRNRWNRGRHTHFHLFGLVPDPNREIENSVDPLCGVRGDRDKRIHH